jgi:hypothetical protein
MYFLLLFTFTGVQPFTVALQNKGNVKWDSGAALGSSPGLGLSCATAASGASYVDPATNNYTMDYVLLVGHKVSCTGSFNFSQADFEAVSGGTKDFGITLPAVSGWTYPKNGGTAASPKTLTVAVTVTPSFSATIETCSLPLNATSRFLC